MNRKKAIEQANQKIRIYNAAVDQALAAGNEQAADSFGESLQEAREARLKLGNA